MPPRARPRPFSAVHSWRRDPDLPHLHAIRRRRLLSIFQLAQVSGVNRNTIAAIERGDTATARSETIRKLAAALEVEPHELLGPVG